MATVSAVKTLRGSVSWDKEWAKRSGSGSGYRWKVTTSAGLPAAGVEIENPTALETTATFKNEGNYKATLYVSDGAILNSASRTFYVKPGMIDIYLKGTMTIPVEVTIPTGDVGVFQQLDAVLDVDTTGSMGGTINTAKAQAAEIVNALFSGGRKIRCAVADFRDVGDAWVTMIRTPLTDSLDEIRSGINAMSAYGGGDGPEAQIPSIYRTCNALSWREGSLRLYIQFTDATAHDPDDGVTGAQAINAMTSRNIQFMGVDCGGAASYLNTMVSATGGQYFSLGSNAAGIVSAIEEALERISNDLTVELVADSDAPSGLVTNIVPASCEIGAISGKYFIHQRPGSKFIFNVTFNRDGLPAGTGEHTYNFKLLIRECRTNAVIDEIPVVVRVNFDDVDDGEEDD